MEVMNDELLNVLGILTKLEERTGALRVRFETSPSSQGLCIVFDWMNVSYRATVTREEIQSANVNLLSIIEEVARMEHSKWNKSELGE